MLAVQVRSGEKRADLLCRGSASCRVLLLAPLAAPPMCCIPQAFPGVPRVQKILVRTLAHPQTPSQVCRPVGWVLLQPAAFFVCAGAFLTPSGGSQATPGSNLGGPSAWVPSIGMPHFGMPPVELF